MTIQTGHGKRRGARAGLGTGKRGNGSTQRDSKAVPRFAPNFSVYVLPPDVVCLYSEDRKFFLHGALYCALAAAIGAGKSVAQIVRELEKDFPSDQIREALKRLADRRFVVPAPRASAGRADAYWASLGMSPADANANLQNCRVRIESIDVQGAKELGAALKALGVRVVRGAADLTVTLVSDYLEARLAELNRRHLSDRTRWLLVQPSGIFPLVGPVFSPGNSQTKTQSKDQGKSQQPEPLLDLSRRAHEPQSRGQGVPRPQAGPPRCGVAARPRPVRTERHRSRVDRDREGDRDRLSHRPERSHRQPRSTRLDHRAALRAGASAMSGLRPQGVARSPPGAGAGRDRRRRQSWS